MQEIMHERMPDDTLLYVRRFDGDKKNVILVLPDVGESIEGGIYPALQKLLPGFTAYFVELRGHYNSQGTHTLYHHWHDIQYWVIRLKKEYDNLYVVARGLSASLLLKYEDQAHYIGENARPPLPDGLILLSPSFTGEGYKTKDKQLLHFRLPAVRTQTPTRIFIPSKEFTTDHLKRFFGNCLTIQAKWLHPGSLTRVELLLGLKRVVKELKSVAAEGKPIRFSSRW